MSETHKGFNCFRKVRRFNPPAIEVDVRIREKLRTTALSRLIFAVDLLVDRIGQNVEYNGLGGKPVPIAQAFLPDAL